MTRPAVKVLGTAFLGFALAATGSAERAQTPAAQSAPAPAAPRRAAAARPVTPAVSHQLSPALSARQQSELVTTYCATCHSERAKAGGLSLAGFDAMKATERQDVVEKMIRKLSAGLMPPPGAKKPEAAVLASLTAALESRMDEFAAANPNPGRRTFQRLNRPEYERAVRELLALDVDAGKWLPLDQKSANFDNIADEQALSPTLLEAYLNAAGDISRMAVGDKSAPRVDIVYTNPAYVSQHPWDHVEGAPYGTRGGLVVNHVFPADAEYEFDLLVISGDNARGEDIDISIDGERVALMKFENGPAAAADGRGGMALRTEPILVRAGVHKVSAAFVRRLDGPYEDLIRPHDWSYAGGGSGGAGITTLPHLRDLVVAGPYNATGVSDSPSRQRIFSCRPTAASEERTCARSILAPPGQRGLSPPDDGGGGGRPDALLREGRHGRRLRKRRAGRARGGARQSQVRVPPGARAARHGHADGHARRRPRPGLAPVVLPVGRAARPGTARPGQERQAHRAGRAREAGRAPARRRPRRRARPPLRRPVAAPAGPRQGQAGSEFLSQLRRERRRGHEARDGAVLQRPGEARPHASWTSSPPTTPS